MRTDKFRLTGDSLAEKFMLLLTIATCALVFLIVFGLCYKSKSILAVKSLPEMLFSSSWFPLKGKFGFLPFIMGTVWVTCVASFLAIPFCLLTSIYLSEYAPNFLREWVSPLIDLLAGIPSVIYGMWGILIIVPLVKNYLAPFFGFASTGYSILAAGIVLAIMISPIIVHVSTEVLKSISHELREASLSLGATKWQTVKHVVMRKAAPGVVGAVVLGLSRAFGETIAVLMVCGNVARIPSSVFDPAYPLPALIANNYGEMLSVPLYDSALLFAALILLCVVIFFNIISRGILIRIERFVL